MPKFDHQIREKIFEIEQLKHAIKDIIPFDTAVKNQVCWCNEASSNCLTPACINARDVLVDEFINHKYISITDCNLGTRIENGIWMALDWYPKYGGRNVNRRNINPTLGDVATLTEHRLYRVNNFGKKSMIKLKEILAEHGLQLQG